MKNAKIITVLVQRVGLFGVVTAGAFGLLLWARLVLVTNHPRTVTADTPIVSEPPPASAASKPNDRPDPDHAAGGHGCCAHCAMCADEPCACETSAREPQAPR